MNTHVKIGKYEVHIPKLFTLLKWGFLLAIAITTALVGFMQSMLVSWLYMWRSTFIYSIVQAGEHAHWKFFEYAGFNLMLAFSCCMALFLISPAASGSGIPDIKAYLNGVESPIFKNFFTIKTFVAKVIGAACAVASSLVMGKEGPMLHVGSAVAVLLGSSRWFRLQMDKACTGACSRTTWTCATWWPAAPRAACAPPSRRPWAASSSPWRCPPAGARS